MPDAVPAIPEKDAVEEVRKACFHFADLYFHFVSVLVAEVGESGAGELVGKVLRERAVERGQRLRERAAELGLEPKVGEFEKVTDIPFLGWDPRLGRETCPYAAAWLPRYADHVPAHHEECPGGGRELREDLLPEGTGLEPAAGRRLGRIRIEGGSNVYRERAPGSALRPQPRGVSRDGRS